MGQSANVDVTMNLGKLTQHVEVAASALRLESQTSELSQILPAVDIGQLPSVARNPMEFVQTMPGVTASYVNGYGKGGTQSPGASAMPYPIVAGYPFLCRGSVRQRYGGHGGWRLHQSTTWPNTPKILPSTDVTQEFSLITNNVSPEYGRATGVLSIITKHGTKRVARQLV